jgi:hypothetical protein
MSGASLSKPSPRLVSDMISDMSSETLYLLLSELSDGHESEHP